MYLMVLGFVLLGIGGAARADVMTNVVFDFETPGQFAGNYRKIFGNGTPVQTGPTVDNDYVTQTGTTNFTSLYDTTPADGTEKTTVTLTLGSSVSFSADLRFATATSSFGVVVVDANNEGAGYLALLNIDQTGTDELIRFSSNAVPNTGGAGTLVTGATGDGTALGQFSNVVFTYGIDANNHPVLSITAGSLGATHTFDTITTPLTNVQLGVRSSSQTVGQNDFDNVGIVVPEPLTGGLLACGGLVLLRRRRS
jgi:hypothetical protein